MLALGRRAPADRQIGIGFRRRDRRDERLFDLFSSERDWAAKLYREGRARW